MARIQTLDILTSADGAAYLAELYGKVVENVQKATISSAMKNLDLSGDPEAGSVEAKRFVNATSASYGTARSALAGSHVKADPVTIGISVDKEIVEELEEKDVRLYGVDGLLERRAANHAMRMEAELDRAFFTEAASVATKAVDSELTAIEDILEYAIQACETVSNSFVDGVPRSMINMILIPSYYGKIRNALDKVAHNANISTAADELMAWHGVKTYSCTHMPATVAAPTDGNANATEAVHGLIIVNGAIAQPVLSNGYSAEKIPLSEATAVSLFYHYGTKAVMPDLIFRF